MFLIVPVYSGGYFWHGNLALCGYCMLFGVAVESALTLASSPAVRSACAVLLVVGAIVATRADAAQGLASGNFSKASQISSTVLTAPPAPFDRVSGDAFVYVEDRQHLGNWYFGVGSLFNLVYLNKQLQQQTVPQMDWIDAKDLSRWLKHPVTRFSSATTTSSGGTTRPKNFVFLLSRTFCEWLRPLRLQASSRRRRR